MFEEEAEEYKDNTRIKDKNTYIGFPDESISEVQDFEGNYIDISERIIKTFKDGAEFGYNKANEWHYVKNGDLPKENEYIMIYSKLADNIAVGKRRCAGKIRKRCMYEWYFATYEGTYCLRDKDIIAWKEIVLPELKEIKEND